MKKAALLRFARGLGYAIGGSAVAYGLTNVDELAAIAPRYAFLVPVLTAGLLAADKWFRAKRSS